MTCYSKSYLNTLATCYWFGINTIHTLNSWPNSSQVVLECYLILLVTKPWRDKDAGQTCTSLLFSSNIDYWLVCVCKSDTSAGRLNIPFAVTSHIWWWHPLDQMIILMNCQLECPLSLFVNIHLYINWSRGVSSNDGHQQRYIVKATIWVFNANRVYHV